MTDTEFRSQRAWITWPGPAHLAVLIGLLVGAYAVLSMVRALRGLLLMLLVALFLSFAMEPAVQFLARRGWRRGAATGLVFIALFIVMVIVATALIQLVVEQVVVLLRTMPRSIGELNRVLQHLPFGIDLEASPELQAQLLRLSRDLTEQFGDLALGVVGIGATALGLIARGLAVALITFYIVADGPRFRRALAAPLAPARQREMLAIWELAVAKTGGYIYARLLIGAVSAVYHGALLAIVGVPFAVPLGIWMGLLTAAIPIVGVPLGGTLLVVAAFVENPVYALWVLAFVLLYQQFENYLLAPKVQAHTMDLHPAVAFTSVLAGASLLGVVGALLALPAAAIVKALLSTYVHRHELIEELAEVPLPPGILDDEEAAPGPEAGRPHGSGHDDRSSEETTA